MAKLSQGFTARQELALARSTHFINIWTGSVSAGKTWGWLWDILHGVANHDGDGELVIIGKNSNTVYRNVFSPFLNDAQFSAFRDDIQYRQNSPTARMFGREVHIVGANDESSAGKIQGATIAKAWGDEVTLWPKSFWDMLVTRLRVAGARFLGTCNPGPQAHYLRSEWMLKPETDTHVEHFTIDDNTFLPASYIAQMKRSFAGVFYRRFILGEWVSAEGSIYQSWDEETMVINPEDMPAMREVLSLGIDYGTTHPTRGSLLGVGVDNKLYVLDEWAPDRGTDATMSRQLFTKRKEWAAKGWVPTWTYVDPAAASFSLQLFEDNHPDVTKADNKVLDGIRTIDSLLDNGQLLISSTCTELIQELPGYRWDEKAKEKGKEQPVKEQDDAVDGLRYAVFSSRWQWAPFLERDMEKVAA